MAPGRATTGAAGAAGAARPTPKRSSADATKPMSDQPGYAEIRVEPDLAVQGGLAMQALYREQIGEPDPSHVGDADD